MNKPINVAVFILFFLGILQSTPLSFMAMAQEPEPLGATDPVDVEEVLASESDVFPSFGTILGEKVRIRTGPGLENKPVSNLGKGTELWVIDKEDDWYLVASPTDPEKPLGWVSAKWMKLTEKPHPDEAPPVASEATPTPVPAAEVAATPEPTPAAVEPAPVDDKPLVENKEPEGKKASKDKKPPVEDEAPPRRKIGKFVGDTKYPVPPMSKGREYLFQISPGFDSLTDDRAGQFDSEMFRATALVAIELVRAFFIEGFYSYASYTPDEPTHEIGGGLRLQGRVYWRFTPYIEGGPFYSTLLDDDNLGFRGGVGLPILVAKRPYHLLIGPYVDYNRVILGPPGDVEHLIFGLTFIFSDFITD